MVPFGIELWRFGVAAEVLWLAAERRSVRWAARFTRMGEFAHRAAYLLATLLFSVAGIHAYWAPGGRWGLQIAIGEGNPLPSSPLIWLGTLAFFAAVPQRWRSALLRAAEPPVR